MFSDVELHCTRPSLDPIPTHTLYQWLNKQHKQPFLSTLFTKLCRLMADSYPFPQNRRQVVGRFCTYSCVRYSCSIFTTDPILITLVYETISKMTFVFFLSKEDIKRLKINNDMLKNLKLDLLTYMMQYSHMRARTKPFPKIAVIEAKFQEDYEWLAIDGLLTYRK